MICPRCRLPITELPDTWCQLVGERLALVHLQCATAIGYHAADLARDLDLRVEVRRRYPGAALVLTAIGKLTRPLTLERIFAEARGSEIPIAPLPLKGGSRNRGEAHGCAKLDEARVQEIRRRAARGDNHETISRLLQIPRPTVSNIIARRTWAHVA